MLRVACLQMTALVLSTLLSGCAAEPPPPITFDPGALKFSGDNAFLTETEFVTAFPNRHSTQPNNKAAAEWLLQQFSEAGWNCAIDTWSIVNYSRDFPLNNVVCKLPGASEKEIMVTAHLDQAPTTVQGADNDGSGIAILLELARIFGAEAPHTYSLTFVATDAEEYGMIGTDRYVRTHPNRVNILADISLDNLGRTYYDAMNMELIGQFQGYGPIWLALTAREAARVAGAKWEVNLRSPMDQVTDQAAPVSLMDEGPAVAFGVPGLGFTGHVPASDAELHFHLWHHPDDTLQYQSAAALGQSGLIAEALIRQLLSMKEFPREHGPYLYLDSSKQVLRGPLLYLVFTAFVAIFFLASLIGSRKSLTQTALGWKRALAHFLGLWLPLVASILLLYALVAVGLMDKFAVYPATSKDPLMYHPRWPAVAAFLFGLVLFLTLGRRLANNYAGQGAEFGDRRSLSMLILGIAGLYLLIINPFSLVFMLPLLFWLLIGNRRGVGSAADLVFFLLGGLVVYGLICVFGFVVLRYDFAFFWYLMNMFSIGMVGFPVAVLVMAILAAGLAVIVKPPARPLA